MLGRAGVVSAIDSKSIFDFPIDQGQRGSLPTKKQGDYLTTLKGKGGAFTEIFNRGKSFPAGYVWLAEPHAFSRNFAWCQRLSDGHQSDYGYRFNEVPVLCVRR
jgi:hypothetical protein